MSKKNEDLDSYKSYLDKWENIGFSRRYEVFRKANKLFGEKNPLLEITDEETVKQDYNQYQREMRQKGSRNTSQRKPTRYTSGSDEEEETYIRKAMRAKSKLDEQEIKQLKGRVTTLERESEDKQFVVGELSDEVVDLKQKNQKLDSEIADLKQKNQKLDAEIVDLKHKFEVYRIESAKTTNEMKANQTDTERRVKDLEENLEKEKLLRQSLEQKCVETEQKYQDLLKRFKKVTQLMQVE
jgi:chromosome segregation ATPase